MRSHSTAADDDAAPRPATVRALLDAMAEAHAEATFLIVPETAQQWTFAEARGRAVRLAQHLAHRGLRRGDTVATILNNGLPAVELILGAMYGGFVPVPLHPRAGRSQLTYALQHCDANVVFVGDEYHDSTRHLVGDIGRAVEVIPAAPALDDDSADGTRTQEPLPPVGPNDRALLIYTSGSTGVPKGAIFTHAQLLACARNTVVAHELTADDRFFCVLPLYHMNSVEKLLGVLMSGSAIVLPERFSVATFWKHAGEHRSTWIAVVPTIISQLLVYDASHAGDGCEALRHIRFVRSSSAPLSPADHQAFEDRFGLVLLQGLGMTEAGGVFLNPLPPRQRKIGSLGVPCGFDVRIVDDLGQDLAPMEVGEILVRGPSLMQGYHKDAAATAEVVDGEGWLRTGDRGYKDNDGYFFNVGRSKELIIKAGTNIAPQAIDLALAAHPAVLEAAAVGVPDRHLGEDIVAHVVLKPEARVTQQELRDFCASRLGEFRTPTRIYFVDHLPKGPSGKVQRLQLKSDIAPERPSRPHGAEPATHVDSTGVDSSARTPIEEALVGLWKEALGLDDVSIHANFFALGGYSLLAVEILARLRQRFSIQAPLRLFFESPTVAAQATALLQLTASNGLAVSDGWRGVAALDSRSRAATAILLAPVRPGREQPPLFCIYGSTRYLDLAKHLGPDQPTYGVLVEREVDFLVGREGHHRNVPSLEELAALYLEQVRAVQPLGPYRLAGHSFGGRVALEIAQQLHRAGEEVALLAVFDTFMPGAFQRLPMRWLTHHVMQTLRSGPTYALRRFRRLVTPLEEREQQFRRALRSQYIAKKYSGSVVLLRAKHGNDWPGYRLDPLLGWGPLAGGGLTVHDVPGDHLGILKAPHVQVVADVLRGHLAPA